MTSRKTPGKAKAVSTHKKVAKSATQPKVSVTKNKTETKKPTTPAKTTTPVKKAKQKTAAATPKAEKPALARKVNTKKKTPPATAPAESKKTVAPSTQTHVSMPTNKQSAKPTAQPKVPVPGEKPRRAKTSKKTEPKQRSPFSAKELKEFYQAMIGLRGRLTVQVAGLREQSLMRHDEVNQDEDGTDAFDRVTSLDRASVDQSRINQINTAIRMIEEGTYGLCEHCAKKIEKPRLQALPFAKSCIVCQSAMEGESVRQRPSIDLLG